MMPSRWRWILPLANPDTLLIVVADHETGGLSLYHGGHL